MDNSFSFNDETASSILRDFKTYLDSQNTSSDRFAERCRGLLKEIQVADLRKTLEAVYGASVRNEEARHHHFSIVLTPPPDLFSTEIEKFGRHCLIDEATPFERAIAITELPKLAPAFENTNQSLRVWFSATREPEIWGIARNLFDVMGFRIQPLSLGELLIDFNCQDFPLVRYLMTFTSMNPVERNTPLGRLFIGNEPLSRSPSNENHAMLHRRDVVYGFVVDVLNKMSLHGHGGTLLFVPPEKADKVMRKSIKTPIALRPRNPFEAIADAIEGDLGDFKAAIESKNGTTYLHRGFQKEATLLAQFTAVDGATVATTKFSVLAIGAKIMESVKKHDDPNRNIYIRNAYKDPIEHECAIVGMGGTRHQSAANFVFDNRTSGVFAIVASQDGKVSIIYWDAREEKLRSFTHAEYSYRGIRYSYGT